MQYSCLGDPMKNEENELDSELKDLVFGTNYSFSEIAKELDVTESWARKRVRELGIGWVRRSKGCASRGQASLTSIVKKLLPGESVVSEYPIGDRLFLDIYCPKYKLGIEFHGKQHYVFTPYFHQDRWDFEQGQKRDIKKMQMCEDLGIQLVVFRYNDDLTETSVFNRILEAIENGLPDDEDEVHTFKGKPFYEAYKQRQREYRQQLYRKMKRGNSGK